MTADELSRDIEEDLDDFDLYDDDYESGPCDGCGRTYFDDGHCPMCCGMDYAPGSEECDFCEYSDECGEGWPLENEGETVNA